MIDQGHPPRQVPLVLSESYHHGRDNDGHADDRADDEGKATYPYRTVTLRLGVGFVHHSHVPSLSDL